jgi:galactokinase
VSRPTVVARAPGRVNLIGDHTDYTGGLCLPIAIDRWVEVEVQPDAGSRVVALLSDDEATGVEIPIDVVDAATVEPAWGRFVAAVIKRLDLEHGFTGTVRSSVPMGAGLSSSAALEVATALALAPDRLDPLALAMLCRDAEHEARGVPTGLLDQLASVFGVAGHALLLDCFTNSITPTPLPPDDEAEFVVIYGGARDLASTGYTDRVDECRRAEAEIGPLRTAAPADVERITDPIVRRRARHVVAENARVREFAAAVAAENLEDAGQIMDASHRSLRDDYESSTPSIDALCDELRSQRGVLGARITGGGWGGCVVAMARPGCLDVRGSADRGGADRRWVVRAVAGASVVTTTDGATNSC